MVFQIPILQPTRFIYIKKKLNEDTRRIFTFVLGALNKFMVHQLIHASKCHNKHLRFNLTYFRELLKILCVWFSINSWSVSCLHFIQFVPLGAIEPQMSLKQEQNRISLIPRLKSKENKMHNLHIVCQKSHLYLLSTSGSQP